MKRILSILLVSFIAMTLLGKYVIPSELNKPKEEKEEEQTQVNKEKTTTNKKPSSFTFMGVGDNLIHDPIFSVDGSTQSVFDFTDIYSLTRPYAKEADLSFLNLETICAGADENLGLGGYPAFNGPVEILDGVLASGFNWLAASSNHSLDWGETGLLKELNYLEANYPDVSVTGAYTSEEKSNQYIVREINGIKVGLLGYTYGTNGIPLPEDKPWIVDLIDEEKIKKDMQEISEISDVQIVSMHWGTEYVTAPTEEQLHYANLLNQLGAEVIIGTHPHVIEPVEMIHGDNQDTLVYYSLGNFISCQDTNDRMVGGMANFTLNYDFNTKKTTFSDVKFIPTVTYIEAGFGNYRTTTIREYTDDMAMSHQMTAIGYDMSKAWIQEYVQSVMGQPEGIEVVYQ